MLTYLRKSTSAAERSVHLLAHYRSLNDYLYYCGGSLLWTLWDLAHRGFAKNSKDENVPKYPFPWGLKSEEELYSIQEKLEKFAVRFVSKTQDAKGRGKSLEGWDRHPTGRGRLDLRGGTLPKDLRVQALKQ